MNEQEQELLEGLRALAAGSPHEAPAYVERRLLTEFRRRSRARRNRMWLSGVGVAAVAASVFAMLWLKPTAHRNVVLTPVVAHQPAIPSVQNNSVAVMQPAVAIRKPSNRRRPSSLEFYALPDADSLPPLETATVVRVQLPMSSLRLIGFPINEDRAGEAVQADVLLGQDGLARGVRLVQ
jgi:hypothetical protein